MNSVLCQSVIVFVIVVIVGGNASSSHLFVESPIVSSASAMPGDQFGFSCASSLSGSVIVISNPGQSTASVLTRNSNGTYSQLQTLRSRYSDLAPLNIATGSALGIADDGSLIFLGAPWFNNGAGGVFVFRRQQSSNDSTVWYAEDERVLVARSSTAEFPGFVGSSIAVSSDARTVVAGAPRLYDQSQNQVGGAVVFVVDQNGVFVEHTTSPLVSSQAQASDLAGLSVAMSTNARLIAVGAQGHNSFKGAVFVFELDESTNNFVELSPLLVPSSSLVGTTVSITDSGSVFTNNYHDSSVVVFSIRSQTIATVSSTDASTSFPSSLAVSADGSLLVAGDFGSNGFQGSVNVYEMNTLKNQYEVTQVMKSAHTVQQDLSGFGYSVGLARDLKAIVIGSIGYNQSQGAAFVFTEPKSIVNEALVESIAMMAQDQQSSLAVIAGSRM